MRGHENCCGCVDVDRHKNLLFAYPLESFNTKLICRDKEIHGSIKINFHPVGVKILQHCQECFVRNSADGDSIIILTFRKLLKSLIKELSGMSMLTTVGSLNCQKSFSRC